MVMCNLPPNMTSAKQQNVHVRLISLVVQQLAYLLVQLISNPIFLG